MIIDEIWDCDSRAAIENVNLIKEDPWQIICQGSSWELVNYKATSTFGSKKSRVVTFILNHLALEAVSMLAL